jgi:O-antigen ligase
LIFGLKLLAPILLLWAILYVPMRAVLGDGVGDAKQFRKIHLAILACTIPNFIAVRVEVFFVLMAMGVWIAHRLLGGDIRAKIAAFWMSVILLVPIHLELGGVGGINSFLSLDHFKVAAAVLLLPAAFGLAKRQEQPRAGTVLLDIAVLAYPLFNIAVTAPGVAVSATVRSLVVMGLDVVLPYFVLTRGLRTWPDVRFVLVRLAAACLFAVAVGLLDFAIQRNIYADLQWVFGVNWSLTHTLLRGNLIRVQAMTSQPILFAAQLILTLGLWWVVRHMNSARKAWHRLVDVAIVGVLVFTFSRGPWLGAIAFGLTLLALSRWSPRFVGVVLLALACAAIGVKAAGLDDSIMTALKTVFGSAREDASSIEYRNQLLDTAIALVRQSPWFGVPDYAAQMQSLVQGEGIIDVVNTYVGVTLNCGIVGLALYLAPFLISLTMLMRRVGADALEHATEQLRYHRVAAALLVGFLLTIFTTSSYERLPFLMLFLIAAPAIGVPGSPRSAPRFGAAGTIANPSAIGATP